MRWVPAVALLVAGAGSAETWVPVADESRVGFEAVQQGAAFAGAFNEFTIVIQFSETSPEEGSIQAEVATGSVDTQYGDRDELLRGPEFFHSEAFPLAILKTSSIQAAKQGYLATAEFRLRDVAETVSIPFTWERLGADRARFSGSFAISRLEFGIGQGDWSNTEWIGETVNVAVDLTLRMSD